MHNNAPLQFNTNKGKPPMAMEGDPGIYIDPSGVFYSQGMLSTGKEIQYQQNKSLHGLLPSVHHRVVETAE